MDTEKTIVDDWCFDNLCGSHLQSYLLDYDDGFLTGCRIVIRHQEAYSRLLSPRRSFSIQLLREPVGKTKAVSNLWYHSARHNMGNNQTKQIKGFSFWRKYGAASVKLEHLGYQTTWCGSNCASKKIAKLTSRALSLFPTGQNVRPLRYQLHEVYPQNMGLNRFGPK